MASCSRSELSDVDTNELSSDVFPFCGHKSPFTIYWYYFSIVKLIRTKLSRLKIKSPFGFNPSGQKFFLLFRFTSINNDARIKMESQELNQTKKNALLSSALGHFFCVNKKCDLFSTIFLKKTFYRLCFPTFKLIRHKINRQVLNGLYHFHISRTIPTRCKVVLFCFLLSL